MIPRNFYTYLICTYTPTQSSQHHNHRNLQDLSGLEFPSFTGSHSLQCKETNNTITIPLLSHLSSFDVSCAVWLILVCVCAVEFSQGQPASQSVCVQRRPRAECGLTKLKLPHRSSYTFITVLYSLLAIDNSRLFLVSTSGLECFT